MSFKPADWPTWELIPSVSLWQAVALSVGVEPEPFSVLEQLRLSARHAGSAIGPQRISVEFARRLRIAEANVSDSGPLVPRTWRENPAFCVIDLRQFGEWAASVGLSLPGGFPARGHAMAAQASPESGSLYSARQILQPIREVDEHKAEELEDLAEVLADELNRRFKDGRRPKWVPVASSLLPASLLARKLPDWYEVVPADSSGLLGSCALRLDMTCSEVLDGMLELMPPNHLTLLWMAQAYQAWEDGMERGEEGEEAGSEPTRSANPDDWAQGQRADAAEAHRALQKDKRRDDARHGPTRRAKEQALAKWVEESAKRPALGKGEFARDFHAGLVPEVAAKVGPGTIERVWLKPANVMAYCVANAIPERRQ